MLANFVFILIGCIALSLSNYINNIGANIVIKIIGVMFFCIYLVRILPAPSTKDVIIYILFSIFAALSSWYVIKKILK